MSKPLPPILQKVARGDLCSGCGACALLSDGLEMSMSDEGFLRPVATGEVSPSEASSIADVCPGLSQTVRPGARRDHALWGPFVEMRVGWATDSELRFRGSSGGVVSALAAYLVASGEVSGVLTNAADPDAPLGNRPIVATTRADFLETAGSRYAPSSPIAHIDAVGDGPHALIAKPCDVVAFRALAARNPDLDRRFPVVLSFFCAGIPSAHGGTQIVRSLGLDPEDVRSFSYRGRGWPGRATATTADGSETSMSYHESWGGILSGQVQTRCKLCADGTGIEADLVCADAWETDEDGYPLFEERDGVSLIVARTEKGRDVLERARAAGVVETRPFEVDDLRAMQPGQVRRRQALLARLAGRRVLGRPVPRYRGLKLLGAARTGRPVWVARNFVGTILRGLRSRR